MSRINEFIELLENCKDDYDKFFNKHNKTAGVRLRKKMQNARQLSKQIRDEVQNLNNINTELTNSIK